MADHPDADPGNVGRENVPLVRGAGEQGPMGPVDRPGAGDIFPGDVRIVPGPDQAGLEVSGGEVVADEPLPGHVHGMAAGDRHQLRVHDQGRKPLVQAVPVGDLQQFLLPCYRSVRIYRVVGEVFGRPAFGRPPWKGSGERKSPKEEAEDPSAGRAVFHTTIPPRFMGSYRPAAAGD